MEKVHDIIGIDISKLTFDAHCYLARQHQQFPNNTTGFKQFLKWLRNNTEVSLKDLLVVMEHTGLYSYRLEQFFNAKSIPFTKQSALEIKRSIGLVRGKSDKSDSYSIAKFGWQKRDELKPDKSEDDYQIKLRNLLSHRELLVTQIAGQKASLTELKHQLGAQMPTFIAASSEYIISVLEGQIKETERQIEQLIESNGTLSENYSLLRSVKGIGFVTSAFMLLYTENFKNFDDAKKFNSYCGIAPFEYGSGTSIKGRTKVSHFANKKMKSLLHQAAIIAAIHDQEIKSYFLRKVAEGKNKMSVYNAIRAKLVARMFAVIKRKTPFQIDYAYAA